MLAKWIKLRIKPECREEFLAAIEVDALGSERDEPGCARFNVLQDLEDENVYYFYEVYKDDEAVAAHREAPHYAVWKAVRHVLDGEPVRTETRAVIPADETYWFPNG